MESESSASIAIIGAGIAGLTMALRAREQGMAATVFEKSRGPGGRLASKRVGDDVSVDMGAQFFTVRNPRFQALLDQYTGDGAFDLWNASLWHESADGEVGHFHPAQRYVGSPRMSAVTRALAQNLSIQSETRITAVTPRPEGWWLATARDQHGPFSRVVITAPPSQTRDLLPTFVTSPLGPERFRMLPCWAVALRFNEALNPGFDGMQLTHDSLGWVARNTSKPERGAAEWWVLHANSSWSDRHRDADPETVAGDLATAFRQRFGITHPISDHLVHRWLYARPASGPEPLYLSTAGNSLGLCGDWLAGGRVEGAFESADALMTAWMADS